jgi:hypothetical protein
MVAVQDFDGVAVEDEDTRPVFTRLKIFKRFIAAIFPLSVAGPLVGPSTQQPLQ